MNNPCAVCKKNHDQLLILGCEHDTCIECATKHYAREMKVQSDFQLTRNMSNFYPCELCFHITKLDAITVAQIKVFAEANKLMRSKLDKRKCKSSTHKIQYLAKKLRKGSPCRLIKAQRILSPRDFSTSSSQNFSTLNFGKASEGKSSLKHFLASRVQEKSEFLEERYSFTPSSLTLSGSLESCDKHLDEAKTYYCFRCSKSICPECVIHGDHVGHEVEAIRKASGKLRGYYNQFLLGTQKYSVLLASLAKEIDSSIQSLSKWNIQQKKHLQECFRELHNKLKEKQVKLIHEMNQTECRSLSKLKLEQQQYHVLSISLKQKRKSLKQMLNLDVNAWNFDEVNQSKQQIQKIGRKISKMAAQKENSKKRQILYLKCDLVEQAIEMIQELVDSFRLNARNKELQGTASFRKIS